MSDIIADSHNGACDQNNNVFNNSQGEIKSSK